MVLGGGEYQSGGAGLSSTAPDYAKFLQMVLRGGELNGNRILSEAGIAEMSRNQVGELRAGYMNSAMPELAPPFEAMPDLTGIDNVYLTDNTDDVVYRYDAATGNPHQPVAVDPKAVHHF